MAFLGGAFGAGEIDVDSLQKTSKFIGSKSVLIDFPEDYYLLDTPTRRFVYDHKGEKVFTGLPNTNYVSPYTLDHERKMVVDHDDQPVLAQDWRLKVVRGVATPLEKLSFRVEWVIIQAKITNLGRVWVGGPNVRRFEGICLNRDFQWLNLGHQDLSTVYIIGNAGLEGVNIMFGSNDDLYLTTPNDTIITTPGGEPITL